MNKINKKITKKIICSAFIISIIAGVAKLSEKYNEKNVPASVNYSENTPIIVLDAGHGECT